MPWCRVLKVFINIIHHWFWPLSYKHCFMNVVYEHCFGDHCLCQGLNNIAQTFTVHHIPIVLPFCYCTNNLETMLKQCLNYHMTWWQKWFKCHWCHKWFQCHWCHKCHKLMGLCDWSKGNHVTSLLVGYIVSISSTILLQTLLQFYKMCAERKTAKPRTERRWRNDLWMVKRICMTFEICKWRWKMS